MVANVVRTPFESFDATVLATARMRIIDVVGCMLGGVHAPGCSMLVDLVREWGGREEATILGVGGKVPAPHAALVNSIMCRSYDFEPAGPIVDGKSTPAHICGTTVPAAIAAAEYSDASGKELLTALILGDDLTSRIIAASNINLDSGFEPTGIANMFGATAVAGRLMGLDERQMKNALGIALNQVSGTFQNIFDGALSFKLPQGLAARGGLFSAALAARGFTGVQDALSSKYGYFALYCKTHQPEVLTKNLGKKFYGDMTFKPYPCCRSNHAAIECALNLVRDHEIRPEDVTEVTVDVSDKGLNFATGQPFEIGDVPQVNAAFSLQYTVASALLRKSVRLEHFTEEYIRDAGVMELIPKIRLTGTVPPETPLAASVSIKMKQGTTYRERVDMPRGNDVYTPLTQEEKQAKFYENVAFSGLIPRADAERAWGMLERLEEIDKIGDILKWLTGGSQS